MNGVLTSTTAIGPFLQETKNYARKLNKIPRQTTRTSRSLALQFPVLHRIHRVSGARQSPSTRRMKWKKVLLHVVTVNRTIVSFRRQSFHIPLVTHSSQQVRIGVRRPSAQSGTVEGFGACANGRR